MPADASWCGVLDARVKGSRELGSTEGVEQHSVDGKCSLLDTPDSQGGLSARRVILYPIYGLPGEASDLGNIADAI
jgi:hypothetical protein